MSASDPAATGLTERDAAQLGEHGIARSEAQRQLAVLRDPPPPRRLARPCVRGDGIRVLDTAEQTRLADLFDRAGGDRLTRLVPASGAATRMFADLVPAPDGELGAAAQALFDQREALPFRDELTAACSDDDWQRPSAVAAALIDAPPAGLGYAQRPKGLIPFHRYPDGARTAFEEHLREAAQTAGTTCRVHFTVGTEHEPSFAELLARLTPELEEASGGRFEVTFSQQSAATDTLALDADGEPFRHDDGSLLLRPGGHGALLTNLDALGAGGAEVVQIKNIDNVVPDRDRALVVRWQRVVTGLLLELQATTHELIDRLETGADERAVVDAHRFLQQTLGETVGDSPERPRSGRLIDRLDRPWRVCGMVANEGEPGGGPFWVRHADGTASPQIVEAAEIDLDDPTQRTIRDAATHFNPVDLVCGLRDRHGNSYRLHDFADPEAVFIADKTHQGRPLRALERPGLWNGAMARWNTVFVEVPAATFAPVKTVLDLLRPSHRSFAPNG